MGEAKAFDSPSSMSEGSDDKNLSERSFKLSYKDMGIDMKSADEGMSMTDSATEYDSASATETSASEQKLEA